MTRVLDFEIWIRNMNQELLALEAYEVMLLCIFCNHEIDFIN